MVLEVKYNLIKLEIFYNKYFVTNNININSEKGEIIKLNKITSGTLL